MLVSIGTYALCDGTRSGGVGTTQMRFRVDREIQVQKIFRAGEVMTYDRGNRKTTVTFEVAYTFPDLETADVFVLTQEDNIPATGIVTFTATKPNGQKVIRYLANGKITNHELTEDIGLTKKYSYTIVGGTIQQTKPSQ